MTVSPEKLKEMRDARRSALLEKWASGARLSPAEHAEISDLIGEPSPIASPAPMVQTPAPPAPAPALVLEPTPPTAFSARSGCIHSLVPGSAYEKTFEVDIRTIKRWREDGANNVPPLYPPLDDPPQMAAWWRAVKKRRVPPRLVQLEEMAVPAVAPPSPSSIATASPQIAPPVPASSGTGFVASPAPAIPTAIDLETGYTATLDRLRIAEATAAQRYATAAASADEGVRSTASSLKREWMDLVDTARTYERDRAKILREAGETWDRAAVVEAVTSIHNIIAPGVRRLWRQVRRRHPQFHALTPPQQDEVFAREADALFTVLLNTGFTSSTVPSPEVLTPVSSSDDLPDDATSVERSAA